MAKTKTTPRRSRRIWRNLLLTVLGLAVFLLMFVSAFVFNPFEGSLPELRDIVPRGVNFFVRKRALDEDFAAFPVPRFWSEITDARGFSAVERGSLGAAFRQEGLDQAVRDAAQAFDRVRDDSGGFLDVLRDLIDYSAKIKDDGLILGHDYFEDAFAAKENYAVIGAVNAFLARTNFIFVALTW